MESAAACQSSNPRTLQQVSLLHSSWGHQKWIMSMAVNILMNIRHAMFDLS